jgi:pimeloyl-ACP methyl ester carboxylesterase
MDRLRPLLLGALLGLAACMPPQWAANAILHPGRTHAEKPPVLPHEDLTFTGDDGAVFKGWLFKATGKRRGLLVALHGMGSNRAAGVGLAHRFLPQGWDVLLYDLRAHGDSGGDFCSFGVLEKRDLSRALDAVHADSAVLFGSSLGGSIALEAAAIDPRIRGVIAQSAFADLHQVAKERTPFFATKSQIAEAFALVEKEGHFRVDDASAVKAAANIHVPVLLIHGGADDETSPEHSRLIEAALKGPKELVIVAGADHRTVLADAPIWKTIDDWMAARSL